MPRKSNSGMGREKRVGADEPGVAGGIDLTHSRKKTAETILAVDIGGTKVAAGLVTSRGRIVSATRGKMMADGSAADGIAAVCEAIDIVLEKQSGRRISAMGVGVPGWVDEGSGTVLNAANLPCWKNFPLAHALQRRYRLPVRVANDAKVAALAEAKWGAGRGYRSVFYATLGTGVGTGLVIGGEIYRGRRGPAGEGGHTTIDFHGPECVCGKRGCAEMYISGPAIAREARAQIAQAPGRDPSAMVKLAGGEAANISAETVVKAAAAGDSLARDVLQKTAERMAVWLGNIIDLLEPDAVVIGGGLAETAISLLPEVRKSLRQWACSPGYEQTVIAKAFYGAESALAGAGALWIPRNELRGARRSRIRSKTSRN